MSYRGETTARRVVLGPYSLRGFRWLPLLFALSAPVVVGLLGGGVTDNPSPFSWWVTCTRIEREESFRLVGPWGRTHELDVTGNNGSNLLLDERRDSIAFGPKAYFAIEGIRAPDRAAFSARYAQLGSGAPETFTMEMRPGPGDRAFCASTLALLSFGVVMGLRLWLSSRVRTEVTVDFQQGRVTARRSVFGAPLGTRAVELATLLEPELERRRLFVWSLPWITAGARVVFRTTSGAPWQLTALVPLAANDKQLQTECAQLATCSNARAAL